MANTDNETTTTTPTNGGRITDELRHYIEGSEQLYGRECPRLRAIADRIDEEHEKAIAIVMNDALYHANDKDMADLGWVRLPVDGEAPCKQLGEWIEKRGLITGPLDHDGELWHKGDMSASPWGEIEGIVFDGKCWKVCGHDTSAPWLPADSLLHYHVPTVEDLLDEFVERWHDTHHDDIPALKAEYAAKLQLRGDAE